MLAEGLARYAFACPTRRFEAASNPTVAAAKIGASAGASSVAVEFTAATALCKVGVQFTMSWATVVPEQPLTNGNCTSNAISAHAPSLAVVPRGDAKSLEPAPTGRSE